MDLKDHIAAAYIHLRKGIAVLAIALPLVLWIGGHLFAGLPLQHSMSAYYHSGGGAMRDVFVGILVAVGTFLILYRGYTWLEDWALNLAGVFVIGVAMFPMQWDCGNSCTKFSLHGTFAVLFFLSIAYVCIFRASDTLGLIANKAQAAYYKKAYQALGIGMIISPAIAVFLTWVLQPHSTIKSTVFFVESIAVLIFASYWILKTREIVTSNSERLALEGRLITPAYRLADMLKPISVNVVAAASAKHP